MTPRLDFTFMQLMKLADPRSEPSLASIIGEAEGFLPDDPKELKTLVVAITYAGSLDLLETVAGIAAKIYVQGRISKDDRRMLGVLLDLPPLTQEEGDAPKEEIDATDVRRESPQQT
jgi:hypothetical protein